MVGAEQGTKNEHKHKYFCFLRKINIFLQSNFWKDNINKKTVSFCEKIKHWSTLDYDNYCVQIVDKPAEILRLAFAILLFSLSA